MTDIPSQNNMTSAPYYQPLNNVSTPYDKPLDNPIPDNYQDQCPPPIEVKQVNNNSIHNASYESPFEYITCILVVMFFTIGTFIGIIFILIGIANNSIEFALFSLIPFFFPLVATILGSCSNIYSIINIESSSGTVIIKRRKICCCFNRKHVININSIKEVIARNDGHTSYEINGVHYNAFEIIFVINDGREIVGCSGAINKDGELGQAYDILRNALPNNIPFRS